MAASTLRTETARASRLAVLGVLLLIGAARAEEGPALELHDLTPPVLKPSGEAFKFWRHETDFTKTYHVDANAPKASDENPGTADAPFKTIGRAAELLQPGERVVVHAGTYRECVRPARGGASTAQMIGYHAEGEVIVKGSEPVGEKWNAEDAAAGLYALDLKTIAFGDYNPFALENLPNASFDIMNWAHPLRGKLPYTLPRGMVFQDGERLQRVATRAELLKTEGAHWTDRDAAKLLIRTRGKKDPNGLLMEITVRRGCFRPRVRGLGFIHVRGFTFEQVGNGFPRPQEGALSVCAGHHWLIERNTVRQVNGVGIDIGHGWYGGAVKPPEEGPEDVGWNIVRRNFVHDTGVCGITGIPASNALIEENVLRNNTLYPIERIYECAGIKTHLNQGTLIRRNLISEQSINGIWMDWDNRDARCTQNVMLNCKTGIFIEASVVEPFCLLDRNLIWGGKQGIYEHDSKNQTFAHNFIGGAGIGLHLRGKITDRTVAKKYPTTGGGHTAANNLFFACKEDIKEHKKPEFAPNVLTGNASEKQGLKAELDTKGLKLTLSGPKALTEFCEKVLVTHDWLDRPWPADDRTPGPVPLGDGRPAELQLDAWGKGDR